MRGYSHFPPYALNAVTGQTMAEIDRTAIQTRGLSGLFLMEQAGRGVAEGLLTALPAESLQQTTILCGKGNNGGDGFVIARRLAQAGFRPLVALLGKAEELQGAASAQFLRMKEAGIFAWECPSEDRLDEFLKGTDKTLVWVDALLGTGTRGAPRGLIAKAIAEINKRRRWATVVAVDIPSGVDADTGRVDGVAVYADWIYTIGLPKIGCLLPPGLDYGKRLVILDIGFPRDLLDPKASPAGLTTAREVDRWIPARSLSAHKGSEGHVLIIAGSRGMTGAALMSAKAAIQAGAGLVSTACPKSLWPVYANGIWEMMTVPVAETEEGSFSEDAFPELFNESRRWTAVVLGPGLGRNLSTQNLARRIVQEVNLPIVVDGDGLSAIRKEDLQQRTGIWVATPHPGEMARLFGVPVSAIQSDRLGYAQRLAESGNGVAVLKGAKTVTADAHGKPYINPTGTPAMASGGMGDTLTGVIGAFLAKGMPAKEAAASGVFLHGLAAELIEEQTHAEAIPATQVISFLSAALHQTRRWAATNKEGFL